MMSNIAYLMRGKEADVTQWGKANAYSDHEQKGDRR